MNENCKYCKTSGTCLEMAEYNSIYCQLHRRIPRVIEKTYGELQQENQQLKDLIVEKDNQIKDIRNQKKDYTEINILTMKLNQKEEIINNLNEFINEYENNRNSFKWNEQDYIDVIDKIKEIIGSDK